MADRGGAKSSGKKKGGADAGNAELAEFTRLLVSRAPEEDVATYDKDALQRAAEIAHATLLTHHSGESVVSVEANPGITWRGRAMSAVTVINDNMPFLFDSITGEINESAGEAGLVLHPVLLVKHDANGVARIMGDASAKKAQAEADRVSLIHVHIPRISASEAEALAGRLKNILTQVRAAVADWKPMLARLDQSITDFRYSPVPLAKNKVEETIAFLEWLRDNNFTFLGMREFIYKGGEKTGELKRTEKPGLGILSDPDILVLRRGAEAVTTTPEIRAFLHGPEPLLVTKANARSLVHRRIYLDYLGIKTFDDKGKLKGELRIVGLFTSTAYTRSVMGIPYLRSKANDVLAKSGFDPADHSGKALINVLESYPRDELFQIDVPTLRRHAEGILALGERPRVRVLYRIDQFDRFVSVIVFVPRDRYDSRVRVKIGDYLKEKFDGRLSAYYPAFPEGSLARVHFIIGRSGGKTPQPDNDEIEDAVREIVRTWDDGLREAISEAGADKALADAAAGFPQSYRNAFAPKVALHDATGLLKVSPGQPVAIEFLRDATQEDTHCGLKIFHYGEPVALSERVPLLENMGFRVISERTFDIAHGNGVVFLHDMELESAAGRPIELDKSGDLFASVFLSVWNGASDNDAYNALAESAGLGPKQIRILRAYGRYLQQAGIPQSQEFVAGVLNRYPKIASDLYELFDQRNNPTRTAPGEDASERILDALDDVPSIDDDTILRRYLNMIDATLRTNHFVEYDEKPVSLAIKLDSRAITGLPQPRPWREIFVYGPQVEGVHLRFGPVARGGLRWSDRAQDYRTEVLGLVKAQQVKNAVIVPVGAKGGFYPKQLPAGGSRDEIFEAGRSAYINFISSLLSVTDNLDGDKVVPPDGIVRHDGDDPYFVVAADKGTATFSDTANGISQANDFWLDDAFASGGSAGYDHKKMGITARGAWEAVKRHFREMNRDIQTEPFTVVGVGDMSGDVFGNGMLLSEQTKVIAAFDHRDIFIDPDPDPATSFAERKRLFEMGRSSWQDYDKTKMSKGGVIVSRAQKSIELSKAAAEAIGLAATTASPVEIMNAILKTPADLMWFGGIGTYVRASSESNQEVGDRANDAIRVTAKEVRAKVVGEGANLGFTQKARIEYGLHGGRCNSDAIDNSAGVNSSDVEVNIKIALAAAMRGDKLQRPARNKLLAAMTDEVASLVLANNYQQTLALSLASRRGAADIGQQARLMASLESRGLLDREVEDLPGAEALAERQALGEPLTRAELGVLLAYAKIVLFDDILASPVPDDPHFDSDLVNYFPDRMSKKYDGEIRTHRLRREIIATELCNDTVNRGGPTFISRLQDLTGQSAPEIVAAFAVVRDGFDLPDIYRAIDVLDTKIDGDAQLGLYQQVGRLVHAASAWFLKNEDNNQAIGARVATLREARAALEPVMGKMLPEFMRQRLADRERSFSEAGAPNELAHKLAMLGIGELVPDIALVANSAKVQLSVAADAFFEVTEAFRIGRVEDAARAIQTSDYYDGLALARASDMIATARRGIAVTALRGGKTDGTPVSAWSEAGGERVSRARERLLALTESGDITVSRLSVAAGLMADLAEQ
ncbi:MAG: NAD-glutamate dehydrogenase [Rhizobiaceae bacterium]|nr:NAD-glutamate dehydrogenase [Rhizobiaceae bacterium]